MSATNRKLVVGNWKMNGLVVDGRERAAALEKAVSGLKSPAFDMVLCPPSTLIDSVSGVVAGSPILCGGQDCHTDLSGAFTGDISAMMLKDLGCSHVILGHSERRQYHSESSDLVMRKALAAHAAGLVAIICVGETDAERTSGKANAVVGQQLRQSIPAAATPENTVVAYEPVWAIGTGKTASADDILQMHGHIRSAVGAGFKILYGGSVKAANAKDIMQTPNVDGVLVGGASLKVDEFMAIAKSASSD